MRNRSKQTFDTSSLRRHYRAKNCRRTI